jgi:HPt (histidine-containing phosphotransfer) domain-containing protein
MFAVFIRETARRLALFRNVSSAHDRHELEIEAHSLKGGAATLGFLEIADIAQRIERQAATITAEGLTVLVDELETAFVKLRSEIATSASRA